MNPSYPVHLRRLALRPLLICLAIIAALTAILLTGCNTSAGASIGHLLTTPGVVEQIAPAKTNIVSQVVTNQAVAVYDPVPIAITNQDGSITISNQPARYVTNSIITTNLIPVVTPPVYFTNLNLSTGVTNGVQAAGAASAAAGFPWGPVVGSGLLSLGSVFLAWYNKNQKRKVQEQLDDHKEQLTTTQKALEVAQDVGQTLVENFETLRGVALTVPGYTPEIDHQVMDAVKTAQAIAGVKSEIHDLVEKHTDDTITTNAASTPATAETA